MRRGRNVQEAAATALGWNDAPRGTKLCYGGLKVMPNRRYCEDGYVVDAQNRGVLYPESYSLHKFQNNPIDLRDPHDGIETVDYHSADMEGFDEEVFSNAAIEFMDEHGKAKRQAILEHAYQLT